ncbi:MAG: urea amidolyase, partial [Mycobacterium sp.]|nr:urea amidolyase [Mycobacterium sp.]
FEPEQPWLLRFFDQVSWYPVSSEELTEVRADVAAGRGTVDITDGEFRIADYLSFLTREAQDIAAVRQRMVLARSEERARWEASGEVGARGKSCATTGQEVA